MESKEVEITEQDVMEVLHVFDRVPSILLKGFVSRNVNVVKSFKNQIDSYKHRLSEEETAKVRRVMFPVHSNVHHIIMDSKPLYVDSKTSFY